MGVAGSGKSTQAGMLAQALKCHRIGVGDLLRSHSDSAQAKQMLAGEMINDELVLSLLDEAIKKYQGKQFILDGSPRSMEQARWWVDKAQAGEVAIDAIIHLQTSEEIAKRRLLARHRPDDHEDAIKERFNEYNNTIKTILGYLRQEGFQVYDINGEQAPEAVQAQIQQAVGVK